MESGWLVGYGAHELLSHGYNERASSVGTCTCFALFVCLPLLASFFLPSLISH